MENPEEPLADPRGRALVEGIARVVALEGGIAWLEPEQVSACGGCKSAGLCGATGGDSRRAIARRFPLVNDVGLRVGERIVIGTYEDTLLRASLVAYALPVVTMLGAAVAGQAMFGGDAGAVIGAALGLAVGLVLARLWAGQLSARGELTPRFVRRIMNDGLECHLN